MCTFSWSLVRCASNRSQRQVLKDVRRGPKIKVLCPTRRKGSCCFKEFSYLRRKPCFVWKASFRNPLPVSAGRFAAQIREVLSTNGDSWRGNAANSNDRKWRCKCGSCLSRRRLREQTVQLPTRALFIIVLFFSCQGLGYGHDRGSVGSQHGMYSPQVWTVALNQGRIQGGDRPLP